MYRAYAADPQMRINLGIRRRLAPLLGNDRRKIELLNALLFSLPGTPVIYYGDEIGMGDNVYLGDRNGVRTPMQWSADRNAGFSTANPHRLYLPLITEQGYHYETVNVETQAANPASLLSWMRQLIAAAQAPPRARVRGTIEFLEPDNHHVLAFVRHPTAEMDAASAAAVRRQPVPAGPAASSSTCAPFAGAVPVEVFGQNRVRAGRRPAVLADARAVRVLLVRHRQRPGDRRPTRRRPAGPPRARRLVARRRCGGGPRSAARSAAGCRAGGGSPARTPPSATSSIDDVVELSDDVAAASSCARRSPRVTTTATRCRCCTRPRRGPSTSSSMQPGALVALLDDGGASSTPWRVPEGAGVVAGAALRRRTRRGRDAVAAGHPRRPGLTKLTDDPRDVHLLGVEQSNSSVILGGRVIAKLIRQLSTRARTPTSRCPLHLRAAGFEQVPGRRRHARRRRSTATSPSNVVVVHDAIANEADLWQWSQDLLDARGRAPRHRARRRPATTPCWRP